jgi:hypothetical protein
MVEGGKLAAMTVGQGLLRLWVVLSICWVLVIGASTWSRLRVDALVPVPDFAAEGTYDADVFKPVDPEEVGWGVSIPFDCLSDDPRTPPRKCYLEDHSKERVEQIKTGAVLAFAPPIGVLVLGLAFAWVVRGFRHQQPKI